jgi:hypothetical protein
MNMAIAIINGKKVEISGPIRGDQLADIATNGREGRRAIMTEKGGVSRKSINRAAIYNPNDFVRDDGKPMVINSIPERVKGAEITAENGRIK